jgi:hypothetical protein
VVVGWESRTPSLLERCCEASRSWPSEPNRSPRDWTEGEGFEPSSEEFTPETVFETAAFNRSATPPGDPPRLDDLANMTRRGHAGRYRDRLCGLGLLAVERDASSRPSAACRPGSGCGCTNDSWFQKGGSPFKHSCRQTWTDPQPSGGPDLGLDIFLSWGTPARTSPCTACS